MNDNLIVKKSSSYYLSILSLIVLVGILVSYFYGQIFFHPNQYLLNDTGDAFKNYFTYEWHVHNDLSILDYDGSNYPYGENHLFTDGMPLLSNFIRFFSFLKPYSIAVFNLSMLISLFLSAIILFKIFNLFLLSNWQCILSALGITILCPQVLRYSGHFALSYGFCIPLIIYLLLKFAKLDKHRLSKSIYISIISLGLFFIHPYTGMICSSFIIFYWVFKMFFDFKKSDFIFILIQAIIPLLLYLIIVKITDSHIDRNAKPYGFFYLISSIETIFISTHKPFRHFLSQIYKITSQNGEGIAYIGLTSLVAAMSLPYLLIKNRTTLIYFKQNVLLKHYVFMALSTVILLLFSMGIPFNCGMEWLLDYASIIQQFRAPGRFAWPFYFLASIGACIMISKYMFLNLNIYIRNGLIIMFLLLYIIEGIPYHNEMTKKQFPINVFNEKLLDNELKTIISHIKKINPQSIIPLPFFHIGTDYYNIPGTGNITNLSFVVSLHTKVPLMANLTPRNSLSEAEKLIQVVSSDVIDKDLQYDLKSNKPIILLYNKEELTYEETSLMQKGETIIETKNYIIKKITTDQLFYNSSISKRAFYEKNKSKLVRKKGFYLTDSSYFEFNGFEKLPNSRYQANVNDTNIILDIQNNSLKKDVQYEVSFWYSTKDRLDLNNMLVIKEINSQGITSILAQKNMYSMQNLYKGKTLATLTFSLKNTQNKIRISLNGSSDREKVFYVSDLMIRQKNVDVYGFTCSIQRKDSILKYNNLEVTAKRH